MNNTLKNRKPEGRPMPATDANAVDAVAYLSRVNFQSVLKVFAALEAIKNAHLLSYEDYLSLTDLENTPSSAPVWQDGTVADSARTRITREFVEKVASDPRNEHLRNLLHLGRFTK